MIGRVLLAALLAGIAAGLLMAFIQHARITPLILEAEKYEHAPAGHDHGSATSDANGQAVAAAESQEEGWKPEDGLERTLNTTLASIVSGAGFAALLAGVSLVSGLPIKRRNGLLWGLCGFLAVQLAPAAGLAPELPGMPAGDLVMRQTWWIGTIIATGLGLYLLATRREPLYILGAILLIALPQVIGAPQPPTHESGVPAGLVAEFVAASLAASAVFWCLIGTFLAFALERLASDAIYEHATA